MASAIISALLPGLISGGIGALGSMFGEKKVSPEYEKISRYSPEQEAYINQIANRLGVPTDRLFDYIQDLLSDDPKALERFSAPAMRQFQEQIIPDIAEQFAGRGVTPYQSSAFQRSLGEAGAGLSERLAAMREQLRPQAASILSGLQGLGMTPTFALQEPGYETTPLGAFAKGFASSGGSFLGDIASQLGQLLNKKRQSSLGSISPEIGAPGA